jgi:hypothetical protein
VLSEVLSVVFSEVTSDVVSVPITTVSVDAGVLSGSLVSDSEEVTSQEEVSSVDWELAVCS